MLEFKVSAAGDGKRTDIFVTEKLPEFSRSSLKGLFEKKLVLVNDRPEEPGDKLKKGDMVRIDTSLLTAKPPSISMPVIYEDQDVVVANKPAGILTHAKGALNTEASFATFLDEHITDKSLKGNRAGVAHRLDRLTSGVIIGARNAGALKYLQKQFSERHVVKTYWAVVQSAIEPETAMIDAPIARNPIRPQTFKVSVDGKAARTEYKRLKTLHKNGQSYSLLQLKPTTGRTHQLRVHLAYVGHPVVGDMVYGQKKQSSPLMLHASSLEIKLPDGKVHKFEAPLPETFKQFL
jgi:23S rRNA pseudouridine1911/1915/1917 synthase